MVLNRVLLALCLKMQALSSVGHVATSDNKIACSPVLGGRNWIELPDFLVFPGKIPAGFIVNN